MYGLYMVILILRFLGNSHFSPKSHKNVRKGIIHAKHISRNSDQV
jgi:hypothetical protein